MWTIVAAVLIAVALYVVENYGGNGFVPSWDQIYQWVGLEPSQSETTAPLPEGKTEVVFLDVGQGDAVLILQNGAACLIDAGPKDARQNLVQDLRSYGVSQLDLLAEYFLNRQTLMILALGLVAFVFDTIGGVLVAKVYNLFAKQKINPMIGAAGISAFPMSARVVNKMGLQEDNQNFLLMHAVGVNVSGQIASVIAGGMILTLFA